MKKQKMDYEKSKLYRLYLENGNLDKARNIDLLNCLGCYELTPIEEKKRLVSLIEKENPNFAKAIKLKFKRYLTKAEMKRIEKRTSLFLKSLMYLDRRWDGVLLKTHSETMLFFCNNIFIITAWDMLVEKTSVGSDLTITAFSISVIIFEFRIWSIANFLIVSAGKL